MTISRLDLDGVGQPGAVAKRIHDLLPDLPLDFDIEDLCRQLDIHSITELDTSAFEAALLMDINKAAGSILLASGSPPARRRFSIGHELGHFLLPYHKPHAGERFDCSLEDLHLLDPKEKDRRKRIEAEANRFAASLLMPPVRVKKCLASSGPDLLELVSLARDFNVSKEAMARTYVDVHPEAVAVIVLRDARLARVYRHLDRFPWIEPRIGQPVPADSIAHRHRLHPGAASGVTDCDPEIWLGERVARRVDVLTEQVLGQSQGYTMVMLHAEMRDE